MPREAACAMSSRLVAFAAVASRTHCHATARSGANEACRACRGRPNTVLARMNSRGSLARSSPRGHRRSPDPPAHLVERDCRSRGARVESIGPARADVRREQALGVPPLQLARGKARHGCHLARAVGVLQFHCWMGGAPCTPPGSLRSLTTIRRPCALRRSPSGSARLRCAC